MYEGKPMVLVIGSTDTGRTPIAAALLRRALGAGVAVRTAGVLAHEGEGAAPEAQLALDQLNIDISRHISRPLRYEEHARAELLLAVDRGTELVLFADFPNDPRVACLPVLANMPDVLDPHRMPLGVWIAAMRQLHDQVQAALPIIRERLGIQDQAPLPITPPKVERRRSASRRTSPVLGSGVRVTWEQDPEMQQLLAMIGSDDGQGPSRPDAPADSSDGPATTAYWSDAGDQQRTTGWLPPDDSSADGPTAAADMSHRSAPGPSAHEQALPVAADASREEHVRRMERMLEAAAEAPEIVDWLRLRGELVSRLRAVAAQAQGALDFAPAASLMLEGKLMQCAALPAADALDLVRRSINHLAAPVTADKLAAIGANMAEW